MAAATALALSSAARQLSRSASTIFTREVSGSHKVTIRKTCRQVWWAMSQPFEAAGYTWRIKYFPNGRKPYGGADDRISLYLELAHGDYDGAQHHFPDYDHQLFHLRNHPVVAVQFKFSLLDLAGNPVPGYSRSTERYHPSSGPIGFDDFAKWKYLRESGALKDDRFTIRCDITAIRDDWSEPDSGDDGGGGGAPPVSSVVVPQSNLHQQLSDLLWKHKHGADVAIDVAGETFDAHGWLLAARSPVFEAELQALMTSSSSSKKEKGKEKEKEGAARRVMKVKGMEPKVFRAMLHFIYTDALPQEEEQDDGGVGVEMARALLAAAHRYKLERLKLMCEEALCKRIDVDTVAVIWVAAEEHQCQALKAACVEFMARPGCMKAVIETLWGDESDMPPSSRRASRQAVDLIVQGRRMHIIDTRAINAQV